MLLSIEPQALYTLVNNLNRRIREARHVAALLDGLIEIVIDVLRPNNCFIWLCAEKFSREHGLPQEAVCDPGVASDPAWGRPGPQPVAALKSGPLKTSFQKAGANLVVPMVYHDEVLGWLALDAPQHHLRYSSAEESFLEILADQGAMAIYCFWLEAELASRVLQLRQAYQRAIRTQEVERRQLAETLHDETLQHLADIAVRLGLLRRQTQIDAGAISDLQVRLAHADRRLREIVRGVHPAILTDLGLVEAVIAFFESVPSTDCRKPVKVTLTVIGFQSRRLADQHLEMTLYRVIQNAVLNALRHAGSDRIFVTIRWGLESVEVCVTDDGCGMKMTLSEAVRAGHFGLLSMRERIQSHGGAFYLSSQPGGGTMVRGRIFLSTPSPAPEAVERFVFELC